jgi:acyl transferase domain-containing protein
VLTLVTKGTQAGDQAEIASISKVFCENAQRDAHLYVGSVKATIGHLECASGVAAIIKSVMMLKSGWIPPNINLVNPKPSLHLDKRQIKVSICA